jgi:universal stress protein E
MTTSQLSPLGRFDKILLATDGSEFSVGAVRVAIDLARKANAELTVMTLVISNPEYDTIAPQLALEAERKAKAIITEVGTLAYESGVGIEPVVRHGQEPDWEIVDVAETMHADLIVMGRRGKRGLSRMMVGHATAKVCGNARCSVLVVPRAAQLWSKRVLVATDGSRCSDSAAVVAGKIGKMFALPVTVVSATRPIHSKARREEAAVAIERVRRIYAEDGIIADTRLVDAPRAEEAIIQAAKDSDADLIVVGSHGRTGLNKILLGSVSERVVGMTEGPVLVVKAG